MLHYFTIGQDNHYFNGNISHYMNQSGVQGVKSRKL